MTTFIIAFITLAVIGSIVALKLKKNSKSSEIKKPIVPTQILDWETTPTETVSEVKPEVTPEPEMPIKPAPVNCQKAQFLPAPEKFSYTDCCGKLQEGEGFQPWEKRAPVGIDSNKEFSGMELIGEEASIDC